jgi:hypothetical protein
LEAIAALDEVAKAFDPFTRRLVRKEREVAVPLPGREGFTFGCDPELFVKNAKGVHVSAAGLIPGTKESPHAVEFGAVQVDGMAAEFNIEPVDNFKDWNHHIEKVMEQLGAMLPKGYTLDAVPSVTFDKKVFDKAPDEARQLGCSPDFDAWTGDVNPPPHDPDNPCLRCAGGHIHVGWRKTGDIDLQHVMACRDFGKQLDWFLGGWALKMDQDALRRRLYGKAGSIRYKEYGMEYRVLSNFWVTTRDRRLAVWNRLIEAINMMQSKAVSDSIAKKNHDLLQISINNSEMDATLLRTFRYPLMTIDQNYRQF